MKNNGKVLIWALIAIFIIATGVLSYGFYGGIKTKNFAKNMEQIINDSQDKWKPDNILDPGGENLDLNNIAELKNYYTQISEDCDTSLSNIAKLKQGRKTKSLKDDTNRYYQIAKESADNALIIVNYMEIMNQVSQDINSISGISSTTTSDYLDQFKQIKSKIDEDVKLLEATKTTPSTKKINNQFLVVLKEFSDLLGQATKYLENNQINELNSLSSQFSSLTGKIDTMEMPDQAEVRNDIITQAEQDELNSLADKIKSQSSDLQKTIFIF